MPGPSVAPDKIAEAVTLRAAGYTTTAISGRTGISLRTLNRLFERHGTKKGKVKDEVIEAAQRDLIEAVTSNSRVKTMAARIVADDLAHAWLLRERIAEASEYLTATNLHEAALLMRAAAAYSTAIKNTSDMLRHSLRTDQALTAVDAVDLPELTVREITADEAAAIQQGLAGDDPVAGNGVAPCTAAVAADEPTDTPTDEENERVEEGDDEAVT